MGSLFGFHATSRSTSAPKRLMFRQSDSFSFKPRVVIAGTDSVCISSCDFQSRAHTTERKEGSFFRGWRETPKILCPFNNPFGARFNLVADLAMPILFDGFAHILARFCGGVAFCLSSVTAAKPVGIGTSGIFSDGKRGQ